MIKLEKIDSNNKTVYVVDEVDNWNGFTEWLYNLEDIEMSLSFSGSMYCFRTKEERRHFVLGFMKAWDLIDDAYLKKSHKDT